MEVFTAAAPGTPPPSAATVHRLRPRLAIGNAPLLPALARVRGFDVLHLHLPFIFGAELVLAGRARRPRPALVVSYHNQLLGEGGRRRLFAAYEATAGRAILRAADRVVAVSDAHAASVPALVALPPGRVTAVPNGVDTEAFAPPAPGARAAARATLDLPQDAVVAAFVATLDRAHHFKRADLAIEALARTGDERLHLLVVGDGEWRSRFEAQARAAGVAARTRFAGALGHDRLPATLGAADFLLLSSEPPESFGIVLIEAMACGRPTVATALPGIRAVVRDGVDGVLAAPGDVRDIAAKMTAMSALDPARRAAMGAAGRARAEAEFAWPRVVAGFEAVYREVLGR